MSKNNRGGKDARVGVDRVKSDAKYGGSDGDGVVKITTIADKEKWDEFVKGRPEANFLQSWDFYEFHKNRGKTVVRRAAVDEKGRILAAYAGVVETAKRGTHLAIAGGPIGDFGAALRSFRGGIEDESSRKAEVDEELIEKGKTSRELEAGTSKGFTKKDKISKETATGVSRHFAEKDIAKNAQSRETAEKRGYSDEPGIRRKLVELIFADMREQGRKNGCVFVRVRPQWEKTEESLALLSELGLKPAPMYLSVEYAGILELNKSEEEILKGASQGFRRKLRKAKKAEIQVSADSTDKSIEEFCVLEKKHAERQKYVAFSGDFLRKQFEAFRQGDEILIYTAKTPEGEVLAQNFMIFYGPEASYHYGVSSEAGTRISAAPLLHLAAMEEARKRGCERYNLWGIVGKDEKEHRFYGVSEFKRSFGVEEFLYTPAHDMVLEPLKYQVTKLIETARKKKRHV